MNFSSEYDLVYIFGHAYWRFICCFINYFSVISDQGVTISWLSIYSLSVSLKDTGPLASESCILPLGHHGPFSIPYHCSVCCNNFQIQSQYVPDQLEMEIKYLWSVDTLF